jgi:hypothetical protein
MLITLRNSGAESIYFTPYLDNRLKLEIISNATSDNTYIQDIFLRGDELSSFILDKTVLNIENIHLVVHKNEWSSIKSESYHIKILTDKGEYRINYKVDSGKPDFFKTIFKYLYPDMAEKQIEELV